VPFYVETKWFYKFQLNICQHKTLFERVWSRLLIIHINARTWVEEAEPTELTMQNLVEATNKLNATEIITN
jgi:hypothetical protein